MYRVRVCEVLLACATLLLSIVNVAQAQEAFSVTVTPPLFQLAIGPGETWSSSLKVVNNNDYDVTYYAHVVDMQASGEEGRSKFTPLVNVPQEAGSVPNTLARWIEITSGPIVVTKGRSADIPFTVTVPADAEPGGHYAAILVGRQSDESAETGSHMAISSFVSSLLFVRIKGDVIEKGRIREFTSEKSLYQTPQAQFTLRFENIGNTHLKPEGDVTIYNMWGKERGKVLVNQESYFGNVLPQSIRRFQFSWEGEQSLFDVGKYSAVVTLAFGEDGKQNVSATTYFWVVPVVPVAIGVSATIIFLLVLVWFIRRYIRRALTLERQRLGLPDAAPLAEVHTPVIETFFEPLREGVIDLRSLSGRGAPPSRDGAQPSIPQPQEGGLTRTQFFSKYKLFFLFLLILIVGVVGVWRYFDKVLVPQRSFLIKDVSAEYETL